MYEITNFKRPMILIERIEDLMSRGPEGKRVKEEHMQFYYNLKY